MTKKSPYARLSSAVNKANTVAGSKILDYDMLLKSFKDKNDVDNLATIINRWRGGYTRGESSFPSIFQKITDYQTSVINERRKLRSERISSKFNVDRSTIEGAYRFYKAKENGDFPEYRERQNVKLESAEDFYNTFVEQRNILNNDGDLVYVENIRKALKEGGDLYEEMFDSVTAGMSYQDIYDTLLQYGGRGALTPKEIYDIFAAVDNNIVESDNAFNQINVRLFQVLQANNPNL